VIAWLKGKNYWNIAELQAYIEAEYEVVFASKQSYYTLFGQAGISWKKTQKCNPRICPVFFVSGANLFRQSTLKFDSKAIERRLPSLNRHRPFLDAPHRYANERLPIAR
jgi:hypothetical protein